MNDELKAAAERYMKPYPRASASSGRDYTSHFTHVAEWNDMVSLAQAMCDRIASAESAPQWRDKPTCAGLWAFPATSRKNSWVIELTTRACELWQWQRPCFGPIPTEPAT